MIDECDEIAATNMHRTEMGGNGGGIWAVEMLCLNYTHADAGEVDMMGMVGEMVKTGVAIGEGDGEHMGGCGVCGEEHILETETDEFVAIATVIEGEAGADEGCEGGIFVAKGATVELGGDGFGGVGDGFGARRG